MPLWVDALHEEALESEQWAAISTLVEARMEHILERRGRASGSATRILSEIICISALDLRVLCQPDLTPLHTTEAEQHISPRLTDSFNVFSPSSPPHIVWGNFAGNA